MFSVQQAKQAKVSLSKKIPYAALCEWRVRVETRVEFAKSAVHSAVARESSELIWRLIAISASRVVSVKMQIGNACNVTGVKMLSVVYTAFLYV